MTLHKHSEIFKFFSKILPNEELLYHSPLPPHRQYDPATTRFQASRLIMSLVPSEAVYDALNSDARSVKKVLFLHRPWKLDRRRVPHGTLVLSSHVRYDELLTTGWNEALADEHHIQPFSSDDTSPSTSINRRCIQGYKNDAERRIGLIGRVNDGYTSSMAGYAARLSEAFQGHEFLHVHPADDATTSASNSSSADAHTTATSINKSDAAGSTRVKALASLNAFTPEIVTRIQDSLVDLGEGNIQPNEVLCLTGAAREIGIEAAREVGFSILAVGHKRCETWGLRYLERMAKREFEGLEIVVVESEDEPEQVRSPTKQQQRGGERSKESRRSRRDGREDATQQ